MSDGATPGPVLGLRARRLVVAADGRDLVLHAAGLPVVSWPARMLSGIGRSVRGRQNHREVWRDGGRRRTAVRGVTQERGSALLPSGELIAPATLVGTELGQTLLVGGRSPAVVTASLASAGALVAVVQTPGLSHFFGCTPLGPVRWSIAVSTSAAATAAR